MRIIHVMKHFRVHFKRSRPNNATVNTNNTTVNYTCHAVLYCYTWLYMYVSSSKPQEVEVTEAVIVVVCFMNNSTCIFLID